jgi:hypothetical protein
LGLHGRLLQGIVRSQYPALPAEEISRAGFGPGEPGYNAVSELFFDKTEKNGKTHCPLDFGK